MSGSPALYERMVFRLRDTFGEPNSDVGHRDHWSLKPVPHMAAINLMVESDGQSASIWVFDPSDEHNGVMRKTIASEAQLNDLIRGIQARIALAVQKNDGIRFKDVNDA